jgi:DNA-binding response OmpR family regulator
MLDSTLSEKRMQPARELSPVIRFGVFEANLYSGELRKNGIKVKIQDLPFRALKLLLGRPNEVLSRDQSAMPCGRKGYSSTSITASAAPSTASGTP